jgi:hypothetical protein
MGVIDHGRKVAHGLVGVHTEKQGKGGDGHGGLIQ